MIPINVIPTWTVDNRSVGSFEYLSAISALRLPRFASTSSLAGLDEMSAISVIAKIPFNTIKNKTINKSITMEESTVFITSTYISYCFPLYPIRDSLSTCTRFAQKEATST